MSKLTGNSQIIMDQEGSEAESASGEETAAQLDARPPKSLLAQYAYSFKLVVQCASTALLVIRWPP